MFSKVAGAFVVVSVLFAAEGSASFSFAEGDCHDYNKNPPFRLCTFIESTKEEVGHGWTCSDSDTTDAIQVRKGIPVEYHHCTDGDRIVDLDRNVKTCGRDLCINIRTSDDQTGQHCFGDKRVSRIIVRVEASESDYTDVYDCQ